MARTLLITVRLHDGRYHGMGDDPPAPARLFQALVAGAGLGGPEELRNAAAALTWLEEREPPIVAAPVMRKGQSFRNYVPNNDLDAKDGDSRRIAEIRTEKVVRPWLFDGEIPFHYAWELAGDGSNGNDERTAHLLCGLTERLYQFGRGVDMAWAWGEVLDREELEERFLTYPGRVFHPSKAGSGQSLACPVRGSFASLEARYAANTRRFTSQRQGSTARQLFAQQPKPRFAQVPYDSPPARQMFELRSQLGGAQFRAWPLARVSALVVMLRDAAVDRLRAGLPNREAEIESFLVGRKRDGADDAPSSSRVRIVPLPSVGHHHADRGIRRVLVEVPADCLLRADDVRWAFSGLDVVDPEQSGLLDLVVTPSADDSILAHYGASEGSGGFRVWRTVTPAALPESARRRRIDPRRVLAEAKGGVERAAEQARAAAAVVQALRHAEVHAPVETMRVQREPFEGKGERVEAFSAGTRFDKYRLWHVEIAFETSIKGPLVIGDGRFLGLGVMAPLHYAHNEPESP